MICSTHIFIEEGLSIYIGIYMHIYMHIEINILSREGTIFIYTYTKFLRRIKK